MSTGATTTESTTASGEPELKRVMGPRLLLLFIVGDILGAGVYAVTGQMAGVVGGIVWLPFLVAFAVATLTALSYLELVTKYPQAAGAALYSHKAFGIHFVTFLVAFAVICSGITSASTSANVLAQNLTGGLVANEWLDSEPSTGVITAIALGFMLLLALINLRGVGESVKFNVVLTLIEITALAIVIGVGVYAMTQGKADYDRIVTFEDSGDKGLFLAVTAATSIAFFAMVGFEDSVNMVEETKDPERIFPRTMITGLGIAVIIYMLVAVSTVAVLTSDQIANAPDGRALLEVVRVGAPDFPIDRIFPFLAVFAVANTSLINMLMASRLLYGLARQDVLPRTLGKVSHKRRSPYVGIAFSTVLALALIVYVANRAEDEVVVNLASVTSLLLLGVFTIVNVACLVLRRDGQRGGFRSPGITPAIAALATAFLLGPWVDREPIVYEIALGLLVIGIVLWALTWLTNRGVRAKKTGFRDIEHMED
ncbi:MULTISPECIES: APC family permease [unclassified Nocardioides]|uniref:APC family permease n=1 Tax=unclassified Nocardioides TaxID=2615069 RepID=UPI002665737F|nr:APC family permease [Nocardioides sp. Arc9.136]WKN50051.1 APC family permease [Nocardioides sp. Arc9.136]